MQNEIRDREFAKFRASGSSLSKVAVTQEGDTGLIQGVEYDEIQATYPDSSTEVYTYYSNAVSVAVIEVKYSDPTKEVLTYAKRTDV